MIIKRRPKHILAIYVEARRIEVVRAQRQWRTWQVGAVEQYHVPEGENLYDYLQRLNLRPRNKQATALILFLPRNHYTFNREHYPLSLQDRLEETLAFDWQENLFYDTDQLLHFSAPAVSGQQQLIVPIFSMPTELYEKFHQSLGAVHFSTFTIIPTAIAHKVFVGPQGDNPATPASEIFARVLGPSSLEVNRFLEGNVIDSFMVDNHENSLHVFRESLRALEVQQEDGSVARPHIQLLCTPDDLPDFASPQWVLDTLPVETCTLEGSLLLPWIEHMITRDEINAFGSKLHLKPWHPPRIVLPLLVTLALYAGFAAFEQRQHRLLTKEVAELQTQRKQLEAQWKPIEQLQTNIAKLQEDQKALAEFDQQAYPVYELFTLLSQITPDDTWLDFLSVANKELQLRGESTSAAKYLSELSKVEGFSNVSFASPVSRNPSSDKERFNVRIVMDIDKLRRTLASRVPVEEIKPPDAEGMDASFNAPPAQEAPPAGESSKQVGPSPTPKPGKQRGVTTSKQPQPADDEDQDEGDEDADFGDDAEEGAQ
jgi:Tfp pilus assembly protein PilN